VFYVLAKDPDGATNVWTATSVAPVTNAATAVTIEISQGTTVGSVVYKLGETTLPAKDIVLADGTFSEVVFSGCGTLTTLAGQYDPASVTLKLPALAENVDSVIVSNLTAGTAVELKDGVYTFLKGDKAQLWYLAKSGFYFSDGQSAKHEEETMTGNIDKSGETPENPTQGAFRVGDSDYYGTFGTAVAAINAGAGNDTLTLSRNYTATTADKVLFKKNATFDLGGNTLSIGDALMSNGKEFGVAAGAAATFTNGTVALGFDVTSDGKGTGRGLAVIGTLTLVDCAIERKGTTSPVFDIYYGTVNVGTNVYLASAGDVFRFKQDKDGVYGTSSVNVYDGAVVTNAGGNSMFYHYKSNETARIVINGGEFSKSGNKGFFGDQNSTNDIEIWNVTISSTAKFNTNETFEFGTAVGKVIPEGYGLIQTSEDPVWYKVDKLAVKPGEPVPATPATAQDIADEMNEKKAQYLAPPPGATVDFSTYGSYFTAQPVDGSNAVAFVLNDVGETAITNAQTVASTNALATVLAASGASTTVSVTTPLAGFYYSMKLGNAVTGIDYTNASTNKLATSAATPIVFEDVSKWSDAGFYQMIVSPTNVIWTVK